VNAGVTVWLWVASVFFAGVALFAYSYGYVAVAIVLGIIAGVGLSVPTVPYVKWRARLNRKATSRGSGGAT
jgi:hypothetical protein